MILSDSSDACSPHASSMIYTQIRRLEGDRDPVFAVSPSEGVIPPEAEVVITATYSPTSVGMFSRDHYDIVTVGGNKVSADEETADLY